MKAGPFGPNFAHQAGTTPLPPNRKECLPTLMTLSKWWSDNVDAVRINEEISNSTKQFHCPLTPQSDSLLASDLCALLS